MPRAPRRPLHVDRRAREVVQGLGGLPLLVRRLPGTVAQVLRHHEGLRAGPGHQGLEFLGGPGEGREERTQQRSRLRRGDQDPLAVRAGAAAREPLGVRDHDRRGAQGVEQRAEPPLVMGAAQVPREVGQAAQEVLVEHLVAVIRQTELGDAAQVLGQARGRAVTAHEVAEDPREGAGDALVPRVARMLAAREPERLVQAPRLPHRRDDPARAGRVIAHGTSRRRVAPLSSSVRDSRRGRF